MNNLCKCDQCQKEKRSLEKLRSHFLTPLKFSKNYKVFIYRS